MSIPESTQALLGAIQQFGNKVADKLNPVAGRTGEALFIGEENVSMSLVPGELLSRIRLANTDVAINNLKSAEVPFSEVFEKWGRISHTNSGVFPALPAELNGWSYDSGTGILQSTINSSSMIGLISPYQFDSYVFETVVRSTAGDDDAIGLCLAFKKVGEVEHSIVAMLDGGGITPTRITNASVPKLLIMVNYPQGDDRGLEVLYQKELGFVKQFWTGADLANGLRLTAKRFANGTMEVEVLRHDGSPLPNSPVKWVGQIPEFFSGKCAVGYVAHSQPGAQWINYNVPTPKSDILDSRDMTVWRWDGVQWQNAGKANTVLTRGRFYKNTEGNMSSLYLDLEGNFVTLGNPNTL